MTNKPEIVDDEKIVLCCWDDMCSKCQEEIIKSEKRNIAEGKRQQKEATEKIVREMIKLVEDFEYIQYEEDIGLVVPYINQTDLLTQLKRLSETKNR